MKSIDVLMRYMQKQKALDKEIEKQNELDALKNTWHENCEHSSGAVLSTDIAETVSQWTKIPISRLTEEEGMRQSRVIGGTSNQTRQVGNQ